MNKQSLILVLQSAFLGAIAEGVRGIAFDYTVDTIMIYVYLNRKQNESDYEIIDIAITEVMSSLPNILYQKIEIIENQEPISKINNYKGWFFVRYEAGNGSINYS